MGYFFHWILVSLFCIWLFHCFFVFIRKGFLDHVFVDRRSSTVSKNLMNENATSFLLILRTEFQSILDDSDSNRASLKFLKLWLHIYILSFCLIFMFFMKRNCTEWSCIVKKVIFLEIRPSSIYFENMLSIRVLECVATRNAVKIYDGRRKFLSNGCRV